MTNTAARLRPPFLPMPHLKVNSSPKFIRPAPIPLSPFKQACTTLLGCHGFFHGRLFWTVSLPFFFPRLLRHHGHLAWLLEGTKLNTLRPRTVPRGSAFPVEASPYFRLSTDFRPVAGTIFPFLLFFKLARSPPGFTFGFFLSADLFFLEFEDPGFSRRGSFCSLLPPLSFEEEVEIGPYLFL